MTLFQAVTHLNLCNLKGGAVYRPYLPMNHTNNIRVPSCNQWAKSF